MERRTFLSVVPVAKRSNLGPIFFLNIRFMYKLLRKKQKTGHKMGKKPLKKVVFPAPPHQLLRISANGLGPFAEFCKWSGPFAERPESCSQHNSPEWKIKW